jgi:DNA-binding NtrC family response regulator
MKIAILEDDDQVASGLAHVLRYLGHESFAVHDLEEARALLTQHDDIGAAMADYGLKGGESGHDFLLWLRDFRPDVQRILTSALARPASFIEDPPKQLFLRKPFGHDMLKTIFGTSNAAIRRRGEQ